MVARLKNSRVVRLAVAVNQRYGDDAGGYLASSIAFYGFLSLFPLILLALSVVGFVLAGNPQLQDRVANSIAAAVPGLDAIVGRNIDRLVATRAGAGIVGLVGLLWSGTGVIGAARSALGRIFRQPSTMGFLRQRVWLVLTTVWLGAVGLVTVGLAAVIGGIRVRGPGGVALVALVPVVTAALDFAMFLLAYRVLPIRRLPWRRLWPGAAFAALGWTALKVAGAWYASRMLTDAPAVYGTFAAAVAAMLLLYLSARLFVYGAELNAVLVEEERGGGVMEAAGTDGQGTAREPVPAGGTQAEARSSAELARSIGSDLVTLVRKEIELAKQEVREGVAARIRGAAALGAGAAFGLFALGFLASAGAWGLDLALEPWLSRLIIGGAFLLLAGVAAFAGRGRLRGVPLAPRRAKETIKEDVEWARAQLRR
ncbi:MAG: YhjD/YihY/BrkB family envelope integrity protein [Actinomycetota bacterium]